MKRLYFIAPDVEQAHRAVNELLVERIPEKDIHVIAREGIPLGDLPEASMMQRSDLTSAIEKGVALGGAAGVLAGLVAISLPTGLVLAGGATVLATTVAGASVGVFGAALKGLDVPNTRLREFEDDIKRGQILIIVDVPADKVETTRVAMAAEHLQVKDKGRDPVMPRFP
ncbi:MAG: DUF1269 domain-containing protein [Acidiferrobacteraceae bacterium]